MCTIHTGRVGRMYPDALDITVKSATGIGRLLAPTKQMVYGYKAGIGDTWFTHYAPLSESDYTAQYLDLLRSRYRANRSAFEALLAQDWTMQCYCAPGAFCHRRIAAEYVLPRIAHQLGITYTDAGEW
jgi:hypothetical protein